MIEARVGLFALLALILLVWGWGWLKSFNPLHSPQKFIVRFHDVAGLGNNATVNINGVRVGTVEKVDLISKGEVNCYIKITAEKVVVTKGSKVTIQTLGLVGAKYLEISLPEPTAGVETPPALGPDDIVIGEDPVRVELVINEMATKFAKVFRAVKSERAGTSLAEALEHSGEAVKNINQASAKLNKNMDKFAAVADSVQATSDKIGAAARNAEGVEASAKSFFSHGTSTMDSVNGLAREWQGTSKRIDKLLDNPNTSGELKETIKMARQTADTISKTIHELNSTLKDESTRQNVMDILDRVDKSTNNIAKSLSTVQGLASDQGLRSDLKEIVGNANAAMTKFDKIINEPDFKTNITSTMCKVQTAADDVDYASRQVSHVLNQRAPLLKMMFGKPGRIPRNQAPNQAGTLPDPAPAPARVLTP